MDYTDGHGFGNTAFDAVRENPCDPWFNRLDRGGLPFDSLRPLKTLMQQINSAIDKIAKLACVKRTSCLIRVETFSV